jgi:lipoyl(octanoyl) transferase
MSKGDYIMKLKVLFLGRCDYQKALDIQKDLLAKRQQGEIEDILILVEHPPVITLGINAEEENIISSDEFLSEYGISIHKINRGGDVTYHGPGQIVGYPIINIKEKRLGVKDFVRKIEEVFIELLNNKYNISAARDPEHTGVWVGNDKITAIGIAVKRYVTMHGFAFNVNTNLEHFKWIVPCGISDRGVTSVERLIGSPVDFDNENKSVIEYFCKIFNYDGWEEVAAIK